jgi:hypothetical protein
MKWNSGYHGVEVDFHKEKDRRTVITEGSGRITQRKRVKLV